MRFSDMVEQEFEHYAVPVAEETKISYSNWQVVKQRTLSAQHGPDGASQFQY